MTMRKECRAAIGAALVVTLLPGSGALAKPATPSQVEQARNMLKDAVAFRTVKGQGQVPAYAAYLAAALKQAGFADADIEITPIGETATLIATLRGKTRDKPIVLSGHMDVVEANPADWERNPFVAVEENGYMFGRGVFDNKYDVTMMLVALSRLKQEGFQPKRDIVLALSGDEETGMVTTQALSQKLKGAEMVLNSDGGGGKLSTDNKPVVYALQAAEKTYANYQIEITDAGGHSSAPTATNPIYRLAKALDRLNAYRFRNESSELTRASLASTAKQIGGDVGAAMARYAADPKDNAAADLIATRPEYVGQIRTTCVATMVNAGHAPNALPQRATANVNCRIFPGVAVEAIRAELATVVADDSAKVTSLEKPTASDASPLRKDVVDAVTRAVHERYPGVPIVPSMAAYATDSLHFRALGIPSYGVSALFMRAEDQFAHGLNERVATDTIGAAIGQWDSVLREIGGK